MLSRNWSQEGGEIKVKSSSKILGNQWIMFKVDISVEVVKHIILNYGYKQVRGDCIALGK